MVNFGEHLLTVQYAPWALYYIDYSQLKSVLEEEYDNNSHSGSHASLLSRQSAVSSEFLSQLYVQTEKVSFFVLQEQGRITQELAECRQELLRGVNVSDVTELVLLEEKYVAAGLALLGLIRFVDLNVTGFRKILKKHDKIGHSKLALSYLALRGTSDMSGPISKSFGIHYPQPRGSSNMEQQNLIVLGNNLLQPLLQDDCITALAAAFAAGISELRQHWDTYEMNHASPTNLDKNSRSNTAPNLLDLGNDEEETSPRGGNNRSHGDLQSMMMMDEAEILARRTMSPGQVLLQIHAARGRLHQTNEFVKLLAAPMMVTTQDTISEGDESASKTEPFKRPSQVSNVLNLLSTFLYMTNYYIVAPTSGTYADEVGSDSSIASIIIGMTSVAALVSTLLYSWWTSYSYKSALIFASTCSVVGNFFYAAGLPWQSLTIVMVGRLLNGFGSARSINRRYIADSYSQAERTAASAAFVTASALGMATGPALASVLHLATERSTSVYWQEVNAPGVFMFVVWVIFLIFLIWKFEDPPKRQKKSDAATVTTASDDNSQQQQQGTLEEKKSLLGTGQSLMDIEEEEESVPICCNIPVIVTLVVYMVLKMVLEAVLSSESNLTGLYFHWHGSIMGVHLAILALLILPVNFGVAFLARSYFDRELIVGLLVAMFLGCLIILKYQEYYPLPQYLVGSAVLFVCASALEAPNMSLLSKVIPRKWSKGIVNVGLLATESGTFGRVVGDVLLAAVGSHGMEQLLNRAFGAYAVIILGTLLGTWAFYDKLVEPPEKDD